MAVIFTPIDKCDKVHHTVHKGCPQRHPMDHYDPSDCQCPSRPGIQYIDEDATSLKAYVVKKDEELRKKIETLNSKIAKVSTLVGNIQGQDAINVLDSSTSKQIVLNIGPKEKMVSQNKDGIFSTLNVKYDKEAKKITLTGLKDKEIASCVLDMEYIPEKVSKVKDAKGNISVKFTYKDGKYFLADINNFLHITTDEDGCAIINGKKIGLKVGADDGLLYVDDEHYLRTRSLSETTDWKEVNNKLKNLTKRLDQFSSDANETGDKIEDILDQIKEIEVLKESQNKYEEEMTVLKKKVAFYDKSFEDIGKSVSGLDASLANIQNEMAKDLVRFQTIDASILELKKEVNTVKESVTDISTNVDTLAAKVEKHDEEITDIKLQVLGGTKTDPDTGEVVETVISIKEEIIGAQTDTSTNTLNGLKNYLEEKLVTDDDFIWNEVN